MKQLEKYNQKRDFDKTNEPAGKAERTTGKTAKRLKFVVQHHYAKREHYDLRLELDGVLVSFAVPKGPSFNPADKRLAIHVEDHPLGYENFEGTIPEGEYGGGTVIIWDQGYWMPETDPVKGLKDGSLKFILKGKRLKGKWFLTRLPRDEGKAENWLLIKEKDEFSNADTDIPVYDKSVKTGRTKQEIEMGLTAATIKNPFSRADIQLAKLATSLPSDGEWLYEMKYDGYRIIAYIEEGSVTLLSRNGKDYTKEFKDIAGSLAQKFEGRAAVLDGEVVIAGENGKTDFQALQNYFKNQGRQPAYVVFDLLALDGEDLRQKPLALRKQSLDKVMKNSDPNLHLSKYSKNFDKDMLKSICDCGFEGIIAKKADSAYTGTRNGDWLKLKCALRQEFVIGGYTRTNKKTSGISSLLLGYYEGKKLIYAGSAGTGITEKTAAGLEEKLLKLKTESSPFDNYSKKQKDRETVWLKAGLAAEIQFAEWTGDNLLRHPGFKGLREDKDVKDIVREKAEETPKTKTALPKDKTITKEIKITNPDKLLFTSPRVTKTEVVQYYQKVAQRMLPLIQNRLLSLVSCPGGAPHSCFFKKHTAVESDGVRLIDASGNSAKEGQYFCITAPSGIIEMAQMNAIEFHIWGSRADNLEKPDMMVFDLDPDEGMELEKVRRGVTDLRDVLKQLNLTAFLKTSGGKGYHVVVPFAPSCDWDAFRSFAKDIAGLMAQKWPELYTANMRKDSRKGKIFIDWMRNIRGATGIAPYSLRARIGARVSMPVSFNELEKIAPDGITMAAAQERLKNKDPWADFYKIGQNQRIK